MNLGVESSKSLNDGLQIMKVFLERINMGRNPRRVALASKVKHEKVRFYFVKEKWNNVRIHPHKFITALYKKGHFFIGFFFAFTEVVLVGQP